MGTPEIPSIKEFFSGKNVLITGGTGFMGKVLIEKLLRSCYTLNNIYVLMRAKKGKSIEERLKIITDLPLFEVLKKERPDAIKKLKAITGDVTQIGLGLKEEDRKFLIKNTHIVYHGAASVRFDDSLADAIIMNTRGAREVATLAQDMEKLEVFFHISTTYCNTDKKVIEERLYPSPADWKDAIKLAETLDKFTFDTFRMKYTHPHPNTYTFSKALAEHVVADLCGAAGIPCVIFRPSIVISSWREPIPGWIDNMNGPVGLCLAIGTGVLRSLYTSPDMVADFLPVDTITKAMIMATWIKGIEKDPVKKRELSVYQGSNHKEEPVTNGMIVKMGETLIKEEPILKALWYPKGSLTQCKYNHFLKVIFYQLLPALLVDGLLKISGRKTMLIKIHRRIYVANMALQYFITNEWEFINSNAKGLEDKLLPRDYQDFNYSRDEVDVFDYFRNAVFGGKMYLLHEGPELLGKAAAHHRRLYMLSWIFNILWYTTVFYLLFFKIDIISLIAHKLNDIYLYFLIPE